MTASRRRMPALGVAAACLATLTGCGMVQSYRSELGLTYLHESYNDEGRNAALVEGTLFLRPVDLMQGPVDQAAFLSRAPYVSLLWYRYESDEEWGTESEAVSVRLSGCRFPLFAEVRFLRDEDDNMPGPGTSLTEGESTYLAAGLFLGQRLEVTGTYALHRDEYPDSTWDEWTTFHVRAKLLHALRNEAAIVVEGKCDFLKDDTWGCLGYDASVTWYPRSDFGVGVSWEYTHFYQDSELGARLIWNFPSGQTARLEFKQDEWRTTYTFGMALRM